MKRTKPIGIAFGLAMILFLLEVGFFVQRSTSIVYAGAQPGAPTTPSIGRATKRALLVGIDTYKYPDRISSLAGSLNDVEDMRALLIGKFEFAPENIVILKDSQATHVGIMNAIQTQLIAKTQPGDIVVFHYSGHGSQMKDVTGKMISGVDETIVPYDSRDPDGKVFDISGAELHPALVQLARKTKNVTFILDSCHSGSLVRGARVRSIPADTRNIPPAAMEAMRGVASAPDDAGTPKFAFISAATSKESAFEHFAEGKDHGSLTYFLARELRSAKAGATYRDVMDPVIANVTANYPSQHPSLEGAEADQSVFGDATSLAGSYVPASPSLLDQKRATLNIGQIEGATAGSTFDVYPPGSKKFAPPERPTARVQLASVDAFSSEATILPGGKVAPASRAIEREHRYRTSRARVYLDGVESSAVLQSVRVALADVKFVEVVEKPTLSNIQLRQVDQSIQTLAADSTTLSTPVSVSDPNAVNRLTGQLKQWARWLNVLAIGNTQSPVNINFVLNGKQTRDPATRVGKPDMGVFEGDQITASLTNNSERDLYVAILDLSGDGSISVVYPAAGVDAVLKPGLTLSRTLTPFVPKGRASVRDVLKAFASYKPVDLLPLTQGSIRGCCTSMRSEPLQELFMDAAGVSRGVTVLLDKPLDLATWTTAQRVLLVKARK